MTFKLLLCQELFNEASLSKLVINNVELVDNEVKLLSMVVDVVFKLLIDNVDIFRHNLEIIYIDFRKNLDKILTKF